MINEETQILGGQPTAETTEKIDQTNEQASAQSESKKSTGFATKAAYAAGGFVAGAASAFGLNAAAAEHPEPETPAGGEEPQTNGEELSANATAATATAANAATATAAKPEELQTPEQPTAHEAHETQVHVAEPAQHPTPEPVDVPDEHEAIIMTGEGIGVGQVSDDLSFGEAFAEARAQVGPGGVFEWHGNVYHTYVEEEWNALSPDERAEFQSRVDYADVMGDEPRVDHNEHHHDYASNHYTGANHETHVHEGSDENVIPAGGEYTDGTGDDVADIKILGVESGYTEDGQFVNLAAAEIDGHDALFVDVDGDGTMDVLGIDINDNGQIDVEQGEAGNIEEMGIGFNELENAVVDPNDDMMAYTNNDMSDYDNGADVGIMA